MRAIQFIFGCSTHFLFRFYYFSFWLSFIIYLLLRPRVRRIIWIWFVENEFEMSSIFNTKKKGRKFNMKQEVTYDYFQMDLLMINIIFFVGFFRSFWLIDRYVISFGLECYSKNLHGNRASRGTKNHILLHRFLFTRKTWIDSQNSLLDAEFVYNTWKRKPNKMRQESTALT